MNTPIVLAWSGGKDSALALERLLANPRWRIAGLLTAVTTEYDRIAIHGVRRSILQRQAHSLALPLFEARILANASNEAYESAFAAALAQARAATPDVRHVAFGDLFLADVRAYREALLHRLDWHGQYPLWGEDTAQLAQYFVKQGHRAILSCVDTQQLAPEFCGRDFDAALLEALPRACDPCGENGEFHTCVHAGPLFTTPISLRRGERVLRENRFQYVDLIED